MLAQPGHEFTARDFYSGNASLRTEILREVGGFSESFTVYGNEDVDLSLRLRARGVELRYDAGALAPGRSTTRACARWPPTRRRKGRQR